MHVLFFPDMDIWNGRAGDEHNHTVTCVRSHIWNPDANHPEACWERLHDIQRRMERLLCSESNDLGFKHFAVLQKYSFNKVYVDKETKQEIVVHTNRIEGAWKHAKDHFKRMAGTKLAQFEGHPKWKAISIAISCTFSEVSSRWMALQIIDTPHPSLTVGPAWSLQVKKKSNIRLGDSAR